MSRESISQSASHPAAQSAEQPAAQPAELPAARAAAFAASNAPAMPPAPVARSGGTVFDDMLEEAEFAIESPVPDWCNLGLMLRIVVALNGLFFCVAALSAASLGQWLVQWLSIVVVVEPVLLASLFFGCLLRRAAAAAPPSFQFAIPVVLPAVLTLVVQNAFHTPGLNASMRWRDALFAALIAACVLYWSRLRERAYSPALAEAQLQALQSRIQPHFLFNSLNAALGLIRSDPRRAETVLEDIADLFRVLMRDSRERVPLSSEIALCKQYLAIEHLRLGDRLVTNWRVDEAAQAALVPSLLLQPLIENAVHHGIEPSRTPGTIDIAVGRSGRYIAITISNPWQGEAAAAKTRGNRIGLDNVRQRLALVHDLEATIDGSVRGDRYVVHVRLPAERRRRPRVARSA